MAIAGRESKGVEIELRGRITPELNISMAYTGMRVEDVDTGSTAMGVPWHAFNLWTTYQVAEHWTIGGGVDARGSIKDVDANDNTVQAPGQARLDAMVRYDAKTWNTTLGVKNIADRRLYDDNLNPAFTYVEPERTVTLSASVKF